MIINNVLHDTQIGIVKGKKYCRLYFRTYIDN